MKVVIIDDENKARKLLNTLLKEQCKEITSFYEAGTLIEGVTLIKKHTPDIVFLDIEMPGHSGLEILEFFKNEPIDFQIIFVTAYNKYAVEAFKLSAIDYLLKPLDSLELKQAVEKAIAQKYSTNVQENLAALKSSFKRLSRKKIALDVPRGIIFIDYEDILYLEADGMYTRVFLTNGKKELIGKPLKHFVAQLEENSNFYKPHRSYVVNLEQINEFHKKDGGYLVMANSFKISISRDKKEDFFKVMNHIIN